MKSQRLLRYIMLAAVVSVLAACAGMMKDGTDASSISYPDTYRSWFHVKSRLNSEGHSMPANVAFQHIYANPKALDGLKSGNYADGSAFVMDRIGYAEAEDKVIKEGARKALLVMVKNRARYPTTGGWGFEAFKGGDPAQRLVSDNGTKCFTCHAPLSKDDFVFSKLRN